ncbi:metal ABC transporter permease [candidate division KSB1 bacterium]
MIVALEFMAAPFLACMLLIGINIYFGIHVIKRDIIFINIAFAQIAALGGTIGTLIHEFLSQDHAGHSHDEHTFEAYILSIIFTMIAALIFTMLKSRRLNISLEALIGIAYAVAATGAVIIVDMAAGGDVHVKEMMEGTILWVSWEQIIELAVVFALIGLFHFIFRKKFLPMSDNYCGTTPNGYSMLWDFLFYTSFGIAVVHSVRVGGILTIFAFLIIPASISALFATRWVTRILIGWGLGTLVTICGLFLSWNIDVPSSPTVILFLGVFLVLAVIVKALGFFKIQSE